MFKALWNRIENGVLRLLNRIATGRKYFLIQNFDGTPYLLRVLIRGYLPPAAGYAPDPKKYKFSVYLHRFLSRDFDRDAHSHPWVFSFSIVLWGGYIEEKRNRRTGRVRVRRVWPGMINILGPRDFHRILELKGRQTWTLFFAGGRASAWGFLVNGIFKRSREYLASKGYVDDGAAPSALPAWLLTCGCCGQPFPPPSRYRTRPLFRPICDGCGAILETKQIVDDSHVGI